MGFKPGDEWSSIRREKQKFVFCVAPTYVAYLQEYEEILDRSTYEIQINGTHSLDTKIQKEGVEGEVER